MKCMVWVLVIGSSLAGSLPAIAQTDTTAETHGGIIIDPVEKMPALWVHGKPIDVVAAVRQRLIYPPKARRAEGRVFVSFTVTASGLVEDIKIAKGFRPDYDSAVVRAVRKLPRFKPSEQLGKPVASRLTVPIKIGKRTRPQAAN